mgnify:CR=1 FL=1
MSWRFYNESTPTPSRWNLSRCDGCGRCSAACPVAEAMDFPPSAVVEMALDGQGDRLARLSAPWICTDCRACSELCPQGVEVAAFLGSLRQDCHLEQRIEDVPVDSEAVAGWHAAFTTTCRASGRAGHWAVFLRYRLRPMDLFTNLALGLQWLLTGRLRVRPRVPSLTIGRIAKRVAALHLEDAQEAEEAEAGGEAKAELAGGPATENAERPANENADGAATGTDAATRGEDASLETPPSPRDEEASTP